MSNGPVTDPVIELRLIGRFVVIRDGAEVPAADFGGRKVRTLLRVLATRRGRFVPNDELTEHLWPDRAPVDPAANLQVLVTRARRAVGRPDLIVTGPGGYALASQSWCGVDTDRLLAALRDAEARTGRAALEVYRGALTDTDVEVLAEDRYADWAQPYRTQLARALQDARERAAAIALDCGEATLAVRYASVAATNEPLRETAALALIRALSAAGDQAAALAHYDTFRTALADELGVDPSPAATALQAQLLALDPGPGRREQTRPAPSAFDPLSFVGRAEELAAIDRALAAGGGLGTARVVRIAGRSGTGKSRLLAEVSVGRHVVSARAFWADRDEPWTLARAVLRDLVDSDVAVLDTLPGQLRTALSHLLPDADATPAAFDPASRRALIIEAMTRLFDVAGSPTLIVDDLQWADPTSARLLAAIAGRAPRLTLVVAYRPAEIDPDGSIGEFLRQQPEAMRCDLGPLPSDAMAELVVDPGIATALASYTDRTPIALSEVIRALADDRILRRGSDGRWLGSTADAAHRAARAGELGQRRAIAARIDAYTRQPGSTALRLLALLARETSARTLAAAAGAPESAMLDALAELSAADLVRLGEQGWALSHDMVGDVIAATLSTAARGTLHGLLAPALDAEEADPAERARHWRDAGDTTRSAAAFVQAATRALDTFADTEAEHLAGAGLAIATNAPPPVRAALHEVRAQARRRRGEIAGAREDLRVALGGYTHGQQRAIVLAQLASLASGADDLRLAAELANLAVVEAGDHPAARALALETASVIDMNLAQPERAADRADEALSIYTRLNDARGAARILDARAMATFVGGDIRGGTALLHRAATLFEDSGDLMRTVTPRSTHGHGLVFLDRPADGLRQIERALITARTLGHPEGVTYALWHRSEALSALGRSDEAITVGREALSIATRIGHRGWTATAWRAIGIGQQTHGELDDALAAFRTSLDLSHNLDLFGCWAAARAGIVTTALGRLDDAAVLVERALAGGPPLGRYEARWAAAELAAARELPEAGRLAQQAAAAAEAGGALIYLARLTALGQNLDVPSSSGPAPDRHRPGERG